jgi:outer membrane receptor protein involved in Fe transport
VADQGQFYRGSDNSLLIKTFDVSYYSSGFYFQDKYWINEALQSTVGFRLDKSSSYDNSFNPRLGLVYRYNSNLTLGAHYGEAFLAPSPFFVYQHFGSFDGIKDSQGRYVSSFMRIPNENLEPEKMRSFEINARYAHGKSTQYQAVIYVSKLDDLILPENLREGFSDFIPGGILLAADNNANTGNLKTYGLELKADYRFISSKGIWDIWANYAYTNGKLKLEAFSREGDVPYAAENKFKLGLTYTLQKSWGTFFMTPSLRWIAQTPLPTSSGQYTSAKSYTITHLYMGWEQLFIDNLSLSVRINNLFDKKYKQAGGGFSTEFQQSPQDPRWTQWELRLRF